PKIVWPPAFVVVRAYLDQLVRDEGLDASRTTAIGAELDKAEKESGSARRKALTTLAAAVDKDVSGAKDQGRVKEMAGAIKALAKV
ncbi:MAG: hypothetical protein ACREMU_07060, partial [Gemmatimonadaceae bacterium]